MTPTTRRGWRHLGRQLVPPILLDTLRGQGRRSASGFAGRYPSFEAAQQATGERAYETTDIVQRTIERTRAVRDAAAADPTRARDGWTMQNLGAMLFALGERRAGRALRVLDFGGGMGIHWFTLEPLLRAQADLTWIVCETEATARAAAQTFTDPRLSFVHDVDRLEGRFDLVLASGSVQYTEAPARYLTRLCALTDALILNRVPLIAEPEDRVCIQTVSSEVFAARLPVWFFSEAKLEARLRAEGLSVALRWSVNEDPLALDGQTIFAQGLVALRR